MYILWKLVLFTVISTGPSYGNDQENIEELNNEESKQRTFLSRSDIITTTKFQCQDKPSGYYADPRYDCKVFHYCQEDGTRITIPCILDTEEHKICIFRDIAFSACEGSEIYLALPEDLQAKPSKETTASAINSATDFKLPNVLPIPSSPENNHSTTPLSLDLEHKEKFSSLLNSNERDSIFEVFNSVLREIQAENNNEHVNPSALKISPATFSRGSRFQASSIRRDDSADTILTKNGSENADTLLVEVYHKSTRKLGDDSDIHHKKSKKDLFLPKYEKKSPATHPRRKKRTIVEPLTVSRPYAVIYAKVPDATSSAGSKINKKGASQRLDILEVPFAPAMVPADVPTIPITIETRRKKKNKSKKKAKNVPHTIFLQEVGHEQTSEQQNVLYFAPEETPSIGLQNTRSRTATRSRQRPRQNTEQSQQIGTSLNSNSEPPQNNIQSTYQTSLADQGTNSLQIPNFPFQPSTFSFNSDVPQYYFPSQDLNQPGNFPAFNLEDQFVLQQQPRFTQPSSFQQPNALQTQPMRQQDRSTSQSRPHENNLPQRIIQTQNSQPQTVRQQENDPRQTVRYQSRIPQNNRIPENLPQTFRQPENIRKPENIPSQIFSQPEISSHTFRQAENVPSIFQQPENMRPQTTQPENLLTQTFRQPENSQLRETRQPNNGYSQTVRQPESVPTLRQSGNAQNQIFRNTENIPPPVRNPINIQPQIVREPNFIQPQNLGQLQNVYLQNVPNFPFGQDGLLQTIRQPQAEEPKLTHNAISQSNSNDNNDNRNSNIRDKRPQQNLQTQNFPGFDSPFFQQFSNFGSLPFNSPYSQPSPQSFEGPHTVRYQTHLNPSQHANTEEKPRDQMPQQMENPRDQIIPHFILSERPQNFNQQNGNQVNQLGINQPGSNAVYQQQSNHNPNLIESERITQGRPTPVHENIGSEIVLAAPEVSRPPRNRIRTTVVTESPTRPPTRQRNRNQSAQRQNTRQGNTRLQDRPRQEPQQVSNYNRRPTEPPRSTSEVVYYPQYQPEVSVSEIPNEVHNRYPSTVADPNVRLQSLQPQSIRDDHRDATYSQRQPTRQRNRQYYYDNANRQTQPQYPSYLSSTTTPVPSAIPRQRTRRPEHANREAYRQNHRQVNKESGTTSDDEKPFYGYRTTPSPYRVRTSPAKESSTERLPVTNMYFVTSTPRFRPPTEDSHTRRPQHHSEVQRERLKIRPQSQIERPPQEYSSSEPVREEYPRAQRYHSQQQPNSNIENDVHIIPAAEDPDIRQRTTPRGTERRPGFRGTAISDRPRYTPEIEHGFLPVSDSPPREHVYDSERDYLHASRASEREHPYVTSAPAREYATLVPEKDHPYPIRTSEREQSYEPNTPEREISHNIRTAGREHLHNPPAPEREYSYVTKAPERDYIEPNNERTRGNRYKNYNEERSTTQSTTTTSRPTKKPRPPPPRPTFPPFPTFPPPPRRTTTTPRPYSEPSKHEKELPETTEYATEYPLTTQKALKKQKYNSEVVTEIPEPRHITENYIQTDSPEVTTRRRSRKRRPRPRRPKATTPYSEDADSIQVESVTQPTTHKEVTTRSTPSNYNRWRQQTSVPRKSTTTTTSTPKSFDEPSEKTEEFGSRINLFGRPRTRKPAAFTPRNPVTTPAPLPSSDSKRITKTPTATRTRKPFVKKVRKKLTTTEVPDVTEPIARSDENEDILHFNSDINFQGLESATQLSVENMNEYQTTEAYNNDEETTTEISTKSYEDDSPIDSSENSENFESTRSVLKKFQNRPRILKFGKPRLRTTDLTIDLNA